MTTRVGIAFAASAVLALAAAARGQTYTLFQDEQRTVRTAPGLSLGPLRVFPRFQIRDVGYDGNIYFGAEPRSDLTATVSPSAKIYWPVGSILLLSLNENPEYVYYRTETRYRQLLNSAAGEARLFLLSRLVLGGSAGRDRHWQRLSSEVGPLSLNTIDQSAVSVHYETPRRTAFGYFHAVRDVHYEFNETLESGQNLSAELDRREISNGFELSYGLSSVSDLFVRAEATDFAFRSQASAWRDSRSVAFRGGLKFPVGGSLQGRISLGYKEFRPEAGGPASFAGLVGDTELRFKRRVYYLLGAFGRDCTFSHWSDVLFFVDTRWTAGGGVYVSPSLRLDYTYDRGIAEYPEPFAFGEASFHRRDRHVTHTLGLVYRVYRTIGLGLTYAATRWTSTLPGWDRTRTFVGATMTFEF